MRRTLFLLLVLSVAVGCRDWQGNDQSARLDRGSATTVKRTPPTLESCLQIDADSDGRLDTLTFRLEPSSENSDTSASLRIVSGDGKELWLDEWAIVPRDMHQFLSKESGGVASRGDFVAQFFCPGDHRIGANLLRQDVPLGWANADQDMSTLLAGAEKSLNVRAADLRKWVVSHNPNLVIRYRRTWPEDMVEIVYVPEVRRFVAIGRGPY